MDTHSFIMHIKTEDFYKDIGNGVEKKFDTLNYEVNTLLLTGRNKKVVALMKDELGEKIMIEFVALWPRTYSYLTDDCKEDKKSKETKTCVIKQRLKFNDYKDCLLKNEIDKIYLYAKDPYEAKYQYLMNKRERLGLDHFKDPKAFIEYSNDMQDLYKKMKITIQERNIKC